MQYINSFNEFIKEGLTKSYPSDTVLKHFINNKILGEENIFIKNSNNTEKIFISINKNNLVHLESILNKMTNIFGYYVSHIIYDYLDDNVNASGEDLRDNYEEVINSIYQIFEEEDTEVDFVFEKKYDTPYEEKLDYVYHITDRKYLDKIFQKGLYPKAFSKRTYHPERIYFASSVYNVKQLLDSFFTVHIDNEVILKVDISNLDINLYYDPNTENGLYTIDNIPPQNIEIEEEI